MRGRRGGRMTLTGWGRGDDVGFDWIEVVRWARESRRWESDFEESRDRWCVNWEVVEGALRVRDCWFSVIAVSC